MGQFSWITQDTNEAIRESYGCCDEELTSAVMHDNRGNKWVEPKYKGYGVFAGKDFYELLAEMNIPNIKGSTDERRSIGIRFSFGTTAIKNKKTGEILKANGINFSSWMQKLLHGMSANDSVKSGEWERISIKEPYNSPNLTRNPDWEWRNEEPKDDPNQGWGE